VSESIPTEDDILRKALFVPCTTKERLHRWICIYLGLNLPDTIVDPESNTSPMDAIWETYSKALANDDPNYSRVMNYASRDSFKTLGAAILEVLSVVHLDRDVAHMAAIKEQAKKAQSYVKRFFRFPYFRDYVTSANTEKTEIVSYEHPDYGYRLTREQYSELPPSEQIRCTEHERYIKIVICTMQGANSEHVPFFVVDEVDVVPKQNQQAYQEAKSIPAMYEGKEPITLLTSTRKFAFGNVQRELDVADKTGLVVRHWNIIDVTERCPPERHLPEEPRVPIYYRRDDFSAIGKEEFAGLAPEQQETYSQDVGYAGCLKNCKLFAMCRGNLATKQREHEKAISPKTGKLEYVEFPRPLLKTIRFTTNKFRELPLDMAKAQLMCWEASQEGLIYPYLSKQKHLIKPCEAAKKITGENYPENLTFEQLLIMLKQREGRWVVGIDFGFTHMFSIVLMFVDGYRAFVLGRWQQAEADPAEKIELLERTVKEFNPVCYADTEQPDMIKFMKKHGFRCPDWSKKPGSVLGGIETVRYKMTPTLSGEPQLYFVDTGPGVIDLMDTLMLYHWELDAQGKPSDQPDEVVSQNAETGEVILDDSCDAIRYAVMNVFGVRGKVTAAREEIKVPTTSQMVQQHKQHQVQENLWAKQIMEHVMGQREDDPLSAPGENPIGVKGKKGGLFWDM
jgi:hypothetical protein